VSRIAEFIVRRSRLVLALTAVLTLVAAAMLFRLDFNADVASFVLEGTPTGEEFVALQEKYAAADPINAMASLPPGETFASLVPIALTIVALLGFIAISGIQLNLLTAVVSSIVLGVGIDYAIHLVAAIDIARKDGDGYVYRALDRAGRPIVANALGIAVALTALWLSPLKVHAQISSMMWVAMITAALATLLVLPALLPSAGTALPEND